MREALRPAVFLDKDGTLIQNVPHNVDPSLIEWQPGAPEALAALQDSGFRLAIVTNQSGIAHGFFTETDLARYLEELRQMLSSSGIELDDIVYCPHHPDAELTRYRRFCSCHKPNPAMLTTSARRLGFDLTRSWMIGDLLDDVEAGHRAGCMSALVHHDGNEPIPRAGIRRPDLITGSLAAAVEVITADMLAAV